MPKLVRLTTTNTNAQISNYFSSEIKLRKNARIALQNLSMEVKKNVIEIDNTNNSLNIQVVESLGPYTAFLSTNIIYNAQNYNDILKDLELALNRYIPQARGKYIGLQWFVNINSNGFFNMKYQISDYDNFINQGKNVDKNVSRSAVTYLRRTGGTPGDFDSYITSNSPFIKGCGRFSIRLLRNGANTNEGISIALSPKNIKNIGTITQDKLENIINYYYDGTNGVLNFNVGGVPNATIYQPNIGDYLMFELENGFIRFIYYDNATSTRNVIYSLEYDYESDLFPYIFFKGDNGYRINQGQYGPKVNFENTSKNLFTDDSDIFGAPFSPSKIATNNYVDFINPTLSQFFGFNNILQPTVNAVEYSLTADSKFQPTDISDSFVVILDSFNLDSYDGLEGKRKNILAVIPKSDNTENGEVIYEPQYPTYIDLNNDYEIALRNIDARILKNDLAPLITNGLTTLTLLVDG